jgi:hypothetical protein
MEDELLEETGDARRYEFTADSFDDFIYENAMDKRNHPLFPIHNDGYGEEEELFSPFGPVEPFSPVDSVEPSRPVYLPDEESRSLKPGRPLFSRHNHGEAEDPFSRGYHSPGYLPVEEPLSLKRGHPSSDDSFMDYVASGHRPYKQRRV